MRTFCRPGKPILLLFFLAGASLALHADTNRWSKIGPDGGDVLKLIMDPRSSQTIYANTNNAGLFKTVDGGAHWRSIDGDLPDFFLIPQYGAVQAYRIIGLSIYPQNTSILYVGVQEKGVYRSLDGGDHWTFQSFPGYINDIAVSPVNGQIVFAATEKGVLKSTDAGQTWGLAYSPNGDRKFITILRFDPRDPATLFAVGLKVAKSLDGGETWSESSPGSGDSSPYDFAIDPNNSANLYVLNTFLYKSTNGGASWTPLAGWFANTITVDPFNSSVLYLGWLSSDPNNFFWNTSRSTDGGQTWSLYALDRYRMLLDPSSPNVVYAAAWKKGIYKSTDGGQTWVFRSQGIQKLEAGSVAFAPANHSPGFRMQSAASTLYVGCPVGVLKSFDGGANWQGTNDDLTNKYFSDLKVEDAAGTTLQAGIMNVSGGMGYSPGGVFKSIDGGVHWAGLNEGLTSRDVRRLVRTASQTPGAWTAGTRPQIMDTLYVATGGGGVFKSTDGGASWFPKNNGFSYFYIDDLILNPDIQNILYAANHDGVFKSENGAETWTSAGLAESTHCLAIDPKNPSILYAGTSQGLYKSNDGGITWNIRSTGLGIVSVTGIDLNPLDSLKLIAGTSSAGVFQSLDGAESWSPLNLGLDFPAIKDVAFDPASPATIYAGTFGDGLYTMTIAPAPRIAVDKTRLDFGGWSGGVVTASQTVWVSNTGEAPLHWTAGPSSQWIQLTPSAGTDNAAINVSINCVGLAPGMYTGTIIVQDPLATNSPQTIAVTLKLYESEMTQAPFGFFDIPIAGTVGITGAIPVTGWALDDIETAKVEIWRDAVAGETEGIWKIGDAIFVEGARPDVEQAYPDYPLNYRAGWGYMLLTNALPNHGNGTYRLHAYAYDMEGNRGLLGTKTVTCDNAHATKPFGTIDSPTQGGNASGTAFVNFGWVLTPLTKTVPKDGSTISVWVDGVQAGDLKTAPNVYNQYRVDVATAFPGLNNTGAPGIGGPVGAFYLDTTKYAKGIHIIYWVATDDAGAADGIGSRYFNVMNAGTSGLVGAEAQATATGLLQSFEYSAKIPVTFESLADLPVSFNPVWVKRGFDRKRPAEMITPDNYGLFRIGLEEVIPIEIDLAGPSNKLLSSSAANLNENPAFRLANPNKALYRGYLLVGSELRPLPIGSTFDAERGVLYWQPGPGFLGDYEFIFVDGFPNTRKTVRIRIGSR